MTNIKRARILFFTIYTLFIITTIKSCHIFGFLFIGPGIFAAYAIIALSSFFPYSISIGCFKEVELNPEKAKNYTVKGWIALGCSIPIKLFMIGYNIYEMISPTSNHWSFG